MSEPGDATRLRTPATPARTPAALATTIAKRSSGALTHGIATTAATARGRLMGVAAQRRLRDAARPLRLCLGSGHAPITDWINVDFEPPADVLVDLRLGLPVDDASVDLIYSEHLVEHFTLEDGERMFKDWRRAIAPSGTVRVATPDLALLINDYRGDWRSRHDWIHWPEYAHIDSPVRMINVAMRAWGHLYLYDFEELAFRLHAAGFSDVRRMALGESDVPALAGLETRADSSLVVEARP